MTEPQIYYHDRGAVKSVAPTPDRVLSPSFSADREEIARQARVYCCSQVRKWVNQIEEIDGEAE